MPTESTASPVAELIRIMALLRSENGCQWDRQQTPASLKKHILEEAYELLEAIDKGDPVEICDELGDLLLQVVFQAQIFAELGQFDIHQVAQTISAKLIRRHPHIFADASHEGHEQRWEQIKQRERKEKGQANGMAQRIPATLPALKRTAKLVKKTEQLDPEEILHQLQEQIALLAPLLAEKRTASQELEGHLEQALLQLCRLTAAADLDPEDLLRRKTSQLIAEIDAQKSV